MKSMYPYAGLPGMVNIGAGMPYYKNFPHTKLSARLHPEAPGAREVEIPLTATDDFELKRYFQYGGAMGDPILLDFIKHLTQKLHEPAYDSWQTIMTCGATDAMGKVVSMLLDPEDEPVMCEQFTYPAAVQQCLMNFNSTVGVPIDDDGIIPEEMERVILENKKGKRIHVLYTVPVGQNPTGVNTSPSRKAAVMELCNKHDIILIEDDPYFHLNYEEYVPSYLHWDTQGRVLRLDTFSKTIAPGSRLGYITGNPIFIERLLRHSEISTQQPSGYVQALVSRTLVDWGVPGFEQWVHRLCEDYRYRLDAVCAALDEEDDSSHEDWTMISPNKFTYKRPAGGMFIWIRVFASDSEALWKTLVEAKVLVSPGLFYSGSSEDMEAGKDWFRVCFCAVSLDDAVAAVRTFKRIVNGFRG